MYQQSLPFFFFFYILEHCSVVWMKNNMFNQLPLEGHLGCFQFGAMTNEATMNTVYRISCDCDFHSPGCLRVRLLECMVIAHEAL